MKKILTAGLVLATMSGAALAADLPSRVAPPVYMPPPVPVFTWTGGYFGINAGYAFDSTTRINTFNGTGSATGVGTSRIARYTSSADGFTGGGQVGYNFQIPGFGGFGGPGSGIVFGVEADAAYTDLNRGNTFSYGGRTTTFRTGLDYLGTVRGRVGYAFNQFLIYGTGGFAYGGTNNRATFVGANNLVNYSGSNSDMATGYAYGGGIEYALPTSSFLNFFKSSAVTIKAEYLHYDLGRSNVTVAATGNNGSAGAYTAHFKNDGDLARVGLNYKFGSY
ncbi:outer membrane protein [Lichenifustis flavocetrariae]|uniref:Porin family protein n=1 Tax=Lichenifustis flavocetrariae TaxID=2949735 RepID=A0AA41YUG1_9HYPH|nr:porin family protein [Lichenifustis flavocetrariae]MCW6507530.1 porin family protein [Lichenifustis flavocetrariae]